LVFYRPTHNREKQVFCFGNPHRTKQLLSKRGQDAWLTLNSPQALNAITTLMATELRDYFCGLGEDNNTRIVVMREAG
jgi:enoyl-CoA hydratase/carnithine racemase